MLNRTSAVNANYQDVEGKSRDMDDVYYKDVAFNDWGKLPADTDVAGFAPGMDDLGQIVLNNKYRVKFNRNTMTEAGARDWVANKNKNIKDPRKRWQFAYEDINDDGIKDVVIRDSAKKIKYINGWHLGKPSKIDLAHQKYIEKTYGLPESRNIAKATGRIPKGALSKNYFLWSNTNYDPKDPDAPLQPNELLQTYGYKARAPSASNLLLSYVTKYEYRKALDDIATDEQNKKMIQKLLSVIQANAYVYKVFVIKPVDDQFASEGRLTIKEAKKKQSGQKISIYSQRCLEMVVAIAGDDKIKTEIYKYIRNVLLPTVDIYQYQAAEQIYYPNSRDPKQFSGSVRRNIPETNTIPNIKSLIGPAAKKDITAAQQAMYDRINETYDTPSFKRNYKQVKDDIDKYNQQRANETPDEVSDPLNDPNMDHSLPKGFDRVPDFPELYNLRKNNKEAYASLLKQAGVSFNGGVWNAGLHTMTNWQELLNYLNAFYKKE